MRFACHLNFIFFYLASGISACTTTGSLEHPQALQIKLLDDATVVKGQNPPSPKKKDEIVETTNEVVTLSAPGKVTVMVVPMQNISQIEAKLPDHKDWASKSWTHYDAERLSSLLESIQEVDEAIANQKLSAAITKLANLKKDFPHLVYLDIKMASCYLLANERGKARAIVESLSSESQKSPQVRRLMHVLKMEAH